MSEFVFGGLEPVAKLLTVPVQRPCMPESWYAPAIPFLYVTPGSNLPSQPTTGSHTTRIARRTLPPHRTPRPNLRPSRTHRRLLSRRNEQSSILHQLATRMQKTRRSSLSLGRRSYHLSQRLRGRTTFVRPLVRHRLALRVCRHSAQNRDTGYRALRSRAGADVGYGRYQEV